MITMTNKSVMHFISVNKISVCLSFCLSVSQAHGEVMLALHIVRLC